MKKICVITGERGAGKSRYCMRLLEKARQEGSNCAGIISPAVYTNDKKTAFFVMDVKTSEQRLCGTRTAPDQGTVGCWQMFPSVLAWGNELIRQSCPCDMLFIDELGPLEFRKREGFTAAFDILRTGGFGTAYTVIRPECIAEFKKIVSDFDIITIGEGSCITGPRI